MSLRFKGGQSIKELSKTSKKPKKSSSSHPKSSKETKPTAKKWVLCQSPKDFTGPIIIIAPSPTCILFSHEDIEKVSWKKSTESVDALEPDHVNQVFIARTIPGEAEGSNKISFKSAFDKYLGVDKYGIVHCTNEALSPMETWEIIPQQGGGFALKSIFNKYLQIDIQDSSIGVRCDSEGTTQLETFNVKCQSDNLVKPSKKRKFVEKEEKDVEIDVIKKNHSWGLGRVRDVGGDVEELKKAREEGKVNETMLDRRAKLKSDKFCK